MGGMGAGMICLEGTGALSHFSLRNKPEVFHEPLTFAAVCVKGKTNIARVLEGRCRTGRSSVPRRGNGASGTSFGLPRFRQAAFSARFPFGTVKLTDEDVPSASKSPAGALRARRDGTTPACQRRRWSIANNPTGRPVEAVFSWNAKNFMAVGENPRSVTRHQAEFVFSGEGARDRSWEEAFSATVGDPAVKVNHAWFRGGW
jgi:hypothetical protein